VGSISFVVVNVVVSSVLFKVEGGVRGEDSHLEVVGVASLGTREVDGSDLEVTGWQAWEDDGVSVASTSGTVLD